MELKAHTETTQDDIRKAKQVVKECDGLELGVDETERRVENLGQLEICHDGHLDRALDGDLAKLYRNGFAPSMVTDDALFIRPVKGEETSAPMPEPLQHVDGEVTQKEPGKYLVEVAKRSDNA